MLLQNNTPKLINNYNLYDTDYYLWIKITLQELQAKNFDQVDWKNLIEEVQSLGKQQQQELENRLIVLIEHLLKLAYWEQEKAYNQRGWKGTIIEQRKQILRLLKRNPSLQPYLLEIFSECYTDARDIAMTKTELSEDIFPLIPTFTIEQCSDEKWFIFE